MTRRHTWILAGLLAAGALIGGAVALTADSDGSGNPGSPALPFVQQATATDQGITVRTESAAFSGTVTLLKLRVDLGGIALGEVSMLSLPREDVSAGSLVAVGPPSGGAMRGGLAEFVLRLSPAVTAGAQTVGIRGVTLQLKDGSERRIAGQWDVAVETPRNIVELLRTEDLSPSGPPATDREATVRAIAASRSTTETVVTVGVEGSPGPTLLGAPSLVDGKEALTGALVETSPDGHQLTFAFPPTRFGSPLVITFGPFSVSDASGGASLVIDVPGILRDNSITGARGERAAVARGRVASTTNPAHTLTGLAFVPGRNDSGVEAEFILGLALDPENREPAHLTLPSGEVVESTVRTIGYSRNGSGTIIGGQTTFRFGVTASKLNGLVRLDQGPASRVLNGKWVVKFTPVR